MQPLLVGHEAGNTRRIILIRWQTENLETLAGHLGSRILHTIGSTGRHLTGNHHSSTLADGFLVPRYLHRSNHRLTRIAKATWRTVIEDIPLAIDLLQGSMRVMTGIRRHQVAAVFIHDHTAAVYQHAATGPRAYRTVAIGIAQRRIATAYAILRTTEARIDHDVFIAYLTDGRGLEELHIVGDKAIEHLTPLALQVHRLLVEFKGRRMLEAIVDISTIALAEVGVTLVGDGFDKHRGVEVDHRAWQTLRTVGSQVDGHKGAIGTVALANHRHALPTTAVRIEPIGLLARGLVHHLHQVGGKHRIPLAIDIVREDRTLVAPLRQVFHWSRPHPDVVTTILGKVGVVRANDIGSHLARMVRVFKHTGFAVGHMLPQRQIRVLSVRCVYSQQRHQLNN